MCMLRLALQLLPSPGQAQFRLVAIPCSIASVTGTQAMCSGMMSVHAFLGKNCSRHACRAVLCTCRAHTGGAWQQLLCQQLCIGACARVAPVGQQQWQHMSCGSICAWVQKTMPCYLYANIYVPYTGIVLVHAQLCLIRFLSDGTNVPAKPLTVTSLSAAEL